MSARTVMVGSAATLSRLVRRPPAREASTAEYFAGVRSLPWARPGPGL